jgi:hypothetical protein
MKNLYALLLTITSTFAFAQQTISFEESEGYQLGTINAQNGWEVTEGSDGLILNQIISADFSSEGLNSFKNAYEPDFGEQFYPIFGASKLFDEPADFTTFTISYDVMINATPNEGALSDFEFTLFAIDENEEYVPVAGVGIENRGNIYLIKDVNYDFDYAEAEWEEAEWVNVRIEVSQENIKYYINNVLESTIDNFTQLNVAGFNMLHNNYGGDAYYDNFTITTSNLGTKQFNSDTVTVYPNPAKDILSVASANDLELTDVSIYNIAGQKVLNSNQSQNINVSSLANGAYFLRATTKEGAVFTKKIIKN